MPFLAKLAPWADGDAIDILRRVTAIVARSHFEKAPGAHVNALVVELDHGKVPDVALYWERGETPGHPGRFVVVELEPDEQLDDQMTGVGDGAEQVEDGGDRREHDDADDVNT